MPFFRKTYQTFRSTPTIKRKPTKIFGEAERDALLEKAKEFSKAVRISKEHDESRPIHNAWVEFCQSTTFHGLSMVLTFRHVVMQILWLLFTLMSMVILAYNIILVIEKYQRNDKIVNVELEFESAPFPAITVCNLNPFKKHLARTVPEISETLDAFHQAVVFSNDAQFEETTSRKKRSAKNGGFRFVQYEPVFSACECVKGLNKECVGKDSVPPSLESACICNYDRQDGSAWPCYSTSTWQEAICPECNDIGFCNVPNTTGTESHPCMCQLKMGYCVLKSDSRIKRVWEFRGNKIPDRDSPFRKDFLEQLSKLGYGNMTDQVAITTQAKEKLILKMSSLHPQRRAALGYGKAELIRMCSFNGLQCDIEKEFKLHIDPAFGNCYTFNADPRKSKASSRAGPNYGLRLMVFVNSSDYLPTTEATGVRIAIHGQEECPFPDTFGYSAPTGVISSFGIGLRKVNRLPIPYGDCYDSDGPLPYGYVYKNYKYEPEGCYRSCYQRRMINKCGCADPRFPAPNDRVVVCDTRNEEIQQCLLAEGAKLSTRKNSCRCVHPCKQDVYSTTYSAAKWPSGSIKMECEGRDPDCNSYYGKHAAMLEIYYEQMSYEILKESGSYLFVNLISDIGGQAGLWIGASVLTLFEILFFLFRCLTILLNRCCRRKPKKMEDENEESAIPKEGDRKKSFGENNNNNNFGSNIYINS
ncbi:unnamed protein product [Auanema sp. JU1783]|nr:unnamed protein product [Auanema sp. JU1783]